MFSFPSNNEFLQELKRTIALLQTPSVEPERVKEQLLLMIKLYNEELSRKIKLS